MIAELFNLVSSGLTGFFTALGSAFTGVTSIVWNVPESGTGIGTPTFLGSLLIIGCVCGMGYMAFRIIRRLVSLRG